jgi:TPR repeat protein
MWSHEPVEHCVAILEEVERRAREKDWRTHFAVHLAYSIGVGAGVREWEEIQRRAFQHLKAAAKASGDSRMYLSVGLHYWHGLNTVARDAEKAQAWLESAASSGEREAVATYKRFLRSPHGHTSANAA